jgi:hypothetical protein
VADLGDVDNHVRAIAARLLCNLAKTDPERRITGDFPALLEVTWDSRFVTAPLPAVALERRWGRGGGVAGGAGVALR